MESGAIVLPRRQGTPFRSAARRLLLAVAALVVIAVVVYLDRNGYRDTDGRVGLVDAFYYATVTASTTGYGDISPVTDQARLVNILLVTPMRVLFVVALVGSAFEVVTATARNLWRQRRYERSLRGHTVVVGYGTRGRAAVRALVEQGVDRRSIVVVDQDQAAVDEAVAGGLAAVHGDATRDGVQVAAVVGDARQIIVAVSHDATSVLATLTSRRLNPSARIVASVRQAENAQLLHHSGADSVVVSAETAGRLLGVALTHPRAGGVLSDLLTPRESSGLVERAVEPEEVGKGLRDLRDLVLSVVRDGRRLALDDAGIGALQPEDRLVVVRARAG